MYTYNLGSPRRRSDLLKWTKKERFTDLSSLFRKRTPQQLRTYYHNYKCNYIAHKTFLEESTLETVERSLFFLWITDGKEQKIDLRRIASVKSFFPARESHALQTTNEGRNILTILLKSINLSSPGELLLLLLSSLPSPSSWTTWICSGSTNSSLLFGLIFFFFPGLSILYRSFCFLRWEL